MIVLCNRIYEEINNTMLTLNSKNKHGFGTVFYIKTGDDDDDDYYSLIKILLLCLCICRLKTLWYTFTGFHNRLEIEVCTTI